MEFLSFSFLDVFNFKYMKVCKQSGVKRVSVGKHNLLDVVQMKTGDSEIRSTIFAK